MVQKKALLERLSAKNTRLDVAARKKEICILSAANAKLCNVNFDLKGLRRAVL